MSIPRTRTLLATVLLSATLAACGSDDDDDAVTPDPVTGEEAPVDLVPDDGVPVGEVPDDGVPVGEVPVDEVPVGEVPGEEMPGEEVPGEEMPGEEVPGEEVPGEEVPGEEVPGEEMTEAGAGPDGVVRLDGGTRSAAEAIGELRAAIEANENLGLVATLDHAANASSVGETLAPTELALFGNPNLGTPLMLASRSAGLDLPQRLLAYETEAEGEEAGGLVVLWNDPAWIAARHGIEGAEETIATIGGALGMLGGRAAGSEEEPVPDTEIGVQAGDGVTTLVSENDFETTYAALRDAITAAGPLTVVAELDHAANAARVGLELPPTRLIVFGNPNLGTPLMQSGRTIGLDLPQKMLVWEDGDTVTIAWNDPAWLAARHGIEDRDEQIATITGALAGLAETAASAGDGDGTDGSR